MSFWQNHAKRSESAEEQPSKKPSAKTPNWPGALRMSEEALATEFRRSPRLLGVLEHRFFSLWLKSFVTFASKVNKNNILLLSNYNPGSA